MPAWPVNPRDRAARIEDSGRAVPHLRRKNQDYTNCEMEKIRRISEAMALGQLRKGITPSERKALENGGEGLVIGRYNRETLLRMLDMDDLPEGQGVDPERLEGLEGALRDYLNRYMPDQPEGHKWIVLSCLFLALVVREPMHPREIVGWRQAGGAYICPTREPSSGSICRWCVCRGET